MPSYMSLAGGNAQSDQTNTQKRTTDYKMDIMMMIKQTLTVPVKNQQHIPLFSEDPKLFFSEKER